MLYKEPKLRLKNKIAKNTSRRVNRVLDLRTYRRHSEARKNYYKKTAKRAGKLRKPGYDSTTFLQGRKKKVNYKLKLSLHPEKGNVTTENHLHTSGIIYTKILIPLCTH